MSKRTLITVLKCTFPVVFNVLFFLWRGGRSDVPLWTSYAFIHVAYLALILAPLARDSRGDVTGKRTLIAISAAYFAAELFVGIVFMLLQGLGFKFVFPVQLVLFALFVVLFIAGALGNRHTDNSLASERQSSQMQKTLSGRIIRLQDETDDEAARAAVRRAYEAVYYCPLMNFPSGDLMFRVEDAVGRLETAVAEKDAGNTKFYSDTICKLIKSVP